MERISEQVYQKWKSSILNTSDNPSLEVLDSLLQAAKQYFECGKSKVAEGILMSAIACSERYLSDSFNENQNGKA